jgi:hypothetical protein
MVWLQADGQKLPSSKDSLLRTALPENFEACTQHSPIMPWLSSATTSTGCTLHLFLSALMNHRNHCRPSRHLAASSIILCTCQIVLRLVVTTWQANQLHSRGPCAMSVHKTKLDRAGGIEISWTSAFTHNILSIQILGIDTHTHTTFCVNDRYMSKIDRTSCFLGKVDFILLASIMSHACML